MRTFTAVFFGALGFIFANQQTNSVSRGRDPRFDSAIFGNSHGQLLDPGRLSEATGLRFIQLTSPGSGPREHMTLMRYFIRHRLHVSAILLVADASWCTHDPALPALYPFPFWLYSGSRLEYLENILSSRSFSALRQRVQLARGRLTPVDPAGFWDYEVGKVWTFSPVIPPDVEPPTLADAPTDIDDSFPAIAHFDRLLAALPADTSLVIVMPPQFYTQLPKLGTKAAAELALCKTELARRVAHRPRSGFADFLVDSPLSRDPANFMDPEHYRYDVAHLIVDRIAAMLHLALRQNSGR